MKITKEDDFLVSDLHWRDYRKEKFKIAIAILNILTNEQKGAVELYGESKYASGYSDGIECGDDL